MKKLSISIGIAITFVVATSIQCLAEDNVIHGCVSKKGELRIVSDPSECEKGEQSISWNQTGPQGEQGPQGEEGGKGDKGDQGEPGTDGLDCWDLNANRSCDPEEDTNFDGICDALDCKGAVHVYDADDQYLGIFLGYNDSNLQSIHIYTKP